MLRKIFYMILFACCFTNVKAQDDLVEHLLELIQVGIIDNEMLLNSKSSIGQVGNVNTIVVNQEQVGLLNNTIFSLQLQTENQAGITQYGSGHSTLLIQNGVNNQANTWSIGSLTATEVYQKGNRNTINSFINNEGILPKSNLLNQIGDDNTMEIALMGIGGSWTEHLPKTVDATQIGMDNSLELILNHAIIPGIKVTQTGGMSLILKHSDFYFPAQ